MATISQPDIISMDIDKVKLNVKVLQAIKEAQGQHGLKYENYQRYRSYCSRRLHRLRRSINVKQQVASSAKARHQRARKMIDITGSMVLEAGEKDREYSERMILIPLYLAERAWSYAMQLKQEVGEQPRKRFHLQRRLRKAKIYAQKFEKLCQDELCNCSEETKLEAQAYAAYISGIYHLDSEHWKEAREYLNESLKKFVRLSLWSDYKERVDEIRASLRYCNFNLGGDDAKVIPVDIPSSIQFHDIAYYHALELLSTQAKTRSVIESSNRPSLLEASFKTTSEKINSENDDEDEEEDWDDACETFDS